MPAIGQVVHRQRQLQRAGGSHPVAPEPGIEQQMPRGPRQVGIVGGHRRDRTGSQLPLPAGVPALQLQRQHIACGTGQAPARLQPRAATGITLAHPGIQAGPRQLCLQLLVERQPCFQLPALAPGTAHIAVGTASTAAAGHRQLIGGIGTEKRQAGPRLRAGLPAQPGFPLLAAGRTQVQRQAGGAIGTVGPLVESRDFQPAAGRQVPAPVGGGREADPGHRRTAVIGRAPAVIRVVGTDVAVGGMELHPAVAQPGLQLPARQRLPGQLRMPVQVPDRIELLAAQAATHPEPGAVEIFPAAAQLALAFTVDPDTPLPGRMWLAGQPQVQPGEVTGQVDHATTMQRVGLRGRRDRQELQHLALPGMRGQAQCAAAQRLLPDRAELVLAHGFTGVEGSGYWCGQTWVAPPFLVGQRAWILGIGGIEILCTHAQRSLPRQVPVQAGGQAAALCTAVFTRAVAAPVHRHDAVADPTKLALQAGTEHRLAIAAALDLQPPRVIGGRAVAEQLHHPATGVAVQGRERATHHLDAVDPEQVELGQLGLPVRGAGRQAVGEHADPAYTEGGTGTVAADGQLQVLRAVVAVACQHPGHAGKRAGQIDTGVGCLLPEPDHAGAGGQVEGITARQPECTYLHRLQGGGRRRSGGDRCGRLQQPGKQQSSIHPSIITTPTTSASRLHGCHCNADAA